jgi:hypothetical protein
MTGTGYAETTEMSHSHYCDTCGGIWSHEDDGCPGPRYGGNLTDGTWDCPICMEDVE